MKTEKILNGEYTRSYLPTIMRSMREKFLVPAVAVSIMNSDSIIHEIQGVRIIDRPEEATLDDYFHIGSCSKSVISLMASKFIEENKISWKTKFFEIFSGLKSYANRDYYDISMEDLLLCKAGIRSFTNPKVDSFPIFSQSIKDQRLEFIKYLIASPSRVKKVGGKFRFLYSNPSYMMASAMLEKIAGLSYEGLIRATLNHQLKLSYVLGWPNAVNAEQPWGHILIGRKLEAFGPDNAYKIPDLISPAGDLSMTPKSYAHYIQLHLQGLCGRDNYISS